MPDALSAVFSLLDLRSARCTRFEAAGNWSLRFPEKSALKFAALLRGGCWMLHPDYAPIGMREGDVFLLSQSPAYVLASDPDLPPEDGSTVIDWARSDTGRYGGDDVVMIAGSYQVSHLHRHLLLGSLPHLMFIPRDAPSAPTLSATLQIMEREFARTGMGSALMRHHLADMLLVQMLRAFASREDRDMGNVDLRQSHWIGALAEPRLGATLDRIHAEPQRKWTVAELAAIAGMSRTSFAQAFHAAVGRAPIDYVLRWRMQVGEKLLHQGRSVSVVADQLGYASQSAFGAAFKRVNGHSPKSVRQL